MDEPIKGSPKPESTGLLQELDRLKHLYSEALQLARRIERTRRLLESNRLVDIRVGMTLAEAERRLVENTVAACSGNKTEAAKLLGLSRHGLIYRLHRYEESQ